MEEVVGSTCGKIFQGKQYLQHFGKCSEEAVGFEKNSLKFFKEKGNNNTLFEFLEILRGKYNFGFLHFKMR